MWITAANSQNHSIACYSYCNLYCFSAGNNYISSLILIWPIPCRQLWWQILCSGELSCQNNERCGVNMWTNFTTTSANYVERVGPCLSPEYQTLLIMAALYGIGQAVIFSFSGFFLFSSSFLLLFFSVEVNSIRMTENRDKCRNYVHGVANQPSNRGRLRSRTKGMELRNFRSSFSTDGATYITRAAAHILVMAALRSRCGHYIFVLWFLLLSSLFPRLISAVADWMSILPHGVALVPI